MLFIFYANPFFFALLVCLVNLLGLAEFYRMGLPAEPAYERWLAVAVGAALFPLLVFAPPVVQMAGIVLCFLLFAVFFLLAYRDLQSVVQRLAVVLFGIFYLPLLLAHLPLLRTLPGGREWIFTVLLLVMIGDSAAYFVGIRLGKRRLYPAISPKKSIEGAVGGLGGNLLGMFIAKWSFFPALRAVDCILLGIFVGAFAQIGDLFESMLKRSFGVKDSGRMIPGHGGLLDRLDSLLFAFVPVYYYALWLFVR